ncbi:hypothetical protein A2223_01865 [Candidatus Falkowbacteria bacterium RIFOXYA2_FULL_35_8]|uniref:Ligand-binding protein SH3 n=1 Tax=Candidatus Falkowbacteria bacterium RIFOXYC2_FULL_36_12 TaxID=1798002 RepID=A0A1F5SYX1_9BACT|nr:MAG: hypothetical protein A2478_05475 [Candidatus Falkowbacteria bacterium RIFOXYC2_FULL_36_12]OGF34005.1 MAG: hypothetical protein A2223_01865 [Candidatus Falkowbacteria bacterium RIFOXYA2_FULL_35_8]
MFFLELVKNLPAELATFLLALIPVTELRASIPIAVGWFNLPILQAFFWSVLGSIFITLVLVYLIDIVSKQLMKFKLGLKFFTWLFARTRRKFEGKYLKYGEIALVIFVAIPLPITGVWTGSVAAFLFGIDRMRSVLLISLGTLIAGIIVSVLTYIGVLAFK